MISNVVPDLLSKVHHVWHHLQHHTTKKQELKSSHAHQLQSEEDNKNATTQAAATPVTQPKSKSPELKELAVAEISSSCDKSASKKLLLATTTVNTTKSANTMPSTTTSTTPTSTLLNFFDKTNPKIKESKMLMDPVFAASQVAYFVDVLCQTNELRAKQQEADCENNHDNEHDSDAVIVDSVYRCVTAAGISTQAYAERLGTYLRTQGSSFILAGVLVQRLWENAPFLFCDFACLKIFATACVISIKFLEDEYYTNSYYADCIGVSVQDLGLMELEFLTHIQFKLCVSPVQFARAKQRLEKIQEMLPMPISTSIAPEPIHEISTTTRQGARQHAQSASNIEVANESAVILRSTPQQQQHSESHVLGEDESDTSALTAFKREQRVRSQSLTCGVLSESRSHSKRPTLARLSSGIVSHCC